MNTSYKDYIKEVSDFPKDDIKPCLSETFYS